MKSQQGFTLLELMIAVAIVAILTAVAIPSYQGYAQRTSRADLEAELMRAAGRLERLKAQNFSYTGATLGGSSSDTVMSHSPSSRPAADAKYNITLASIKADGTVDYSTNPLAAGAVGFELKATSTSRFDSHGTEVLKINHLGQKCYKALGASVTDCDYTTDQGWP